MSKSSRHDEILSSEATVTMEYASHLPKKTRHTTDKFFLMLLLLSWAAMTIIGLSALGIINTYWLTRIRAGNPILLTNGVDYEGNICGTGDTVGSKTYRPNFYGTNLDSNGNYAPALLAVCVDSCPKEDDIIADPYGSYGFWTAQSDSKQFVNSCVPMEGGSSITSATTIYSDFMASAGVVGLAGCVLAVVVSMLFLFVVRIPMFLRAVVWMCILLVTLLLTSSALTLLEKAKGESDKGMTEVLLLKTVGGILVGCLLIWICIVCTMRSRIALAISIIKESAVALSNMTILCFLPFLQTGLFIAFTALWLYFGVYLVSSAEVTTYTDDITGYSYKLLTFDIYAKRAIVFLVFVWFWSVGFIESHGQIVAAHSVLKWYFAPDRHRISSIEVLSSAYIVSRYHMGTAAAGSLIISLLRTTRMALEYVQLRLAVITQSSRLARLATCCLGCLLWIFEKFIKFLNKHAYIQCAMHGTDFLSSARRAFVLISRNLGRLAAVSVVGDFVVLVGKLSITLTCSAIAYTYMDRRMSSELQGLLLPTLLVAFVAFSTCTLFLGVLSATADTLLQACIVDEQLQRRHTTKVKRSSDVYGVENGVEDDKHETGGSSPSCPSHKQGIRSLVVEHQHQWKQAGQEALYNDEEGRLLGEEGDEWVQESGDYDDAYDDDYDCDIDEGQDEYSQRMPALSFGDEERKDGGHDLDIVIGGGENRIGTLRTELYKPRKPSPLESLYHQQQQHPVPHSLTMSRPSLHSPLAPSDGASGAGDVEEGTGLELHPLIVAPPKPLKEKEKEMEKEKAIISSPLFGNTKERPPSLPSQSSSLQQSLRTNRYRKTSNINSDLNTANTANAVSTNPFDE